ncbi:hypothetical protein GLOIN_2v1779027 [Rhizophagus clarus]|uniref:Uncharacterized protein n=2 Tax=Rhizophagus clarus TaxID=94130 RepID=A0A8H3QTE0_9GLOM|nr:hypothetical protein GLOIN_2v1779027 [Rhizophagus clarus]
MHTLNRHLNIYSLLRPVDLLDQKQFPDLHLILDGKLKELAELGKSVKNGSSPLTIEECQQILQSPIITRETPSKLLKRIFFYNALFLGLRDHPGIIADYDLYFTKRPINAKENFYLQEITDKNVYIYQGRWYLKNQIEKLRLQGFLHNLAIECGISAEGRKITNHSGHQNTLTSCSTTSMIINEQNSSIPNDNQNINRTPNTISMSGFRSALQVAKENIFLQQVSVNNDKKMKEPLQEDENDKNISNSNVDIESFQDLLKQPNAKIIFHNCSFNFNK